MPRYYFHVYDDVEALDDEGLDRADAEAAVAGAVNAARELAAEEVRRGKLNLGHRIEVEDESGSVIAAVMFRDCVLVEG